MVAASWSEIAQEKFVRNEEWFMFKKGKYYLHKNLFGSSFLLGSWRGNQSWSFPLIRS
jgi:hypothetical protein